MARKKLLLKRLLLAVGASLFAVFLFEVGLRVAGYSRPIFFQTDAVRGMAMRPGIEGWYREEGEGFIQVNADGFRDVAHRVDKPADTLRVAVLGDSFVSGFQVPFEDTFTQVIGRQLTAAEALQGKRVEMFNFGNPGYGTAQALLTLQSCAWKYQPDVVVLAFFAGNDVSDNSRELSQKAYRPYFVHDKSARGALALDASFRDSSEYRVRSGMLPSVVNASRVLQLLNGFRQDLRKKGAVENMLAKANPKLIEANLFELGLDNMVFEPTTQAWRTAWQVTEDLVVKMHEEVREKGAEFLLVTLSSGIQVHPDKAVRKRFREILEVETLTYPEQRLTKLGARIGFPVLTLAEPLRAHAERHDAFLHGFDQTKPGAGHWNALGHRLAGELIARRLAAVLAKR